MLSLKTWTAKTENAVIVVTAETVEVARAIVERERGIVLTNADLVPLPTHHRHVRLIIPVDKAAIVAELERLYDEWQMLSVCRDGQISHAKALGTCDGLDLAIQVVQAGGALPPGRNEEGK
jgi:hypothetical protein